MVQRAITILFTSLILYGCSPPEPSDDLEEQPYFRLDKVIEEQKALLEENPPESISKKVIMEGDEEEQEQDTSAVREVLEFISDNDINLPAYRGLYDQKDGYASEESDLREMSFDLKENEDAPVQFLKIFYYPEEKDSLAGIAAFRENHNPLYYTYQITRAKFRQGKMKQASIQNQQKILLFSPTRFTVELDLRYE